MFVSIFSKIFGGMLLGKLGDQEKQILYPSSLGIAKP